MPEAKIGAHLKSARQRVRLTQEELGGALSVSAQTISNWERDVSQPAAAQLPALAAALGISISAIFGVPDQRPATLEEEGLLAYTVEERSVFTDEDYQSIRDFIEYRKAKRLAERRAKAEGA